MKPFNRLADLLVALTSLIPFGLIPFCAANAAETQLPLPDVTVTAPGAPNAPPYLRDPAKSMSRNPYMGRFRVEEDKFVPVSCAQTRIATTAGGICLQGYKLTPGMAAC